MPVLYANDIGGIGALLQQDQSRRDALSQQDFLNLYNQHMAQTAEANRQQEFARQTGIDAQNQLYQQFQMQHTRDAALAAAFQHNQEFGLREKQFNANQVYQNWTMKQQQKGYLTQQENLYKDALSIATAGGSPSLEKLSPEQQANVKAAQSLSAEEHNKAATLSGFAAQTLNQHERALRFKSALEKDVQGQSQSEDASILKPWTWSRALVPDSESYNQNTDALKALNDQLPDLSGRAAKITSDKNLSALVRYNPNSGFYEPVVQPRQLNMATTPAPIGASLTEQRATRFTPNVPTQADRINRRLQIMRNQTGMNAGFAQPPSTGTNLTPFRRQNGVIFQLMQDGTYQPVGTP